ncbi:flagellar basal-body rod protein FlgF [bacterium]|nr:flagellar basal-body rod protein FlgF [bacterium]
MKEIYQVMSAAVGQEMRIDQIANNLANVNTPGFKKDGSVFLDELQARLAQGATGDPAQSANPAATVWPSLPRTYTDLANGPMQQTGRNLDIAIESDGFLKVQGRDGQTCYTRAGNLALAADGKLVTASGQPVLNDQNRPITIDQAAGGEISINPDGRILANKTEVGRLGVARFSDATKLVKRGEGLLVAPAGVAAQAVENPQVRQGMLEGSNVNPIDEMVRMIQTQRMYEAQQKIVQTYDDLAGKRIDAMQ